MESPNVAYLINGTDVSSKSYVDNTLESYTPLADFNDLSSVVATNSNDIDVLQGKTQNISASSTDTNISSNTQVILRQFGSFIVRDDVLNPLLGVSQAEVDIHKTLNLNTNRVTGLIDPTANSDAYS